MTLPCDAPNVTNSVVSSKCMLWLAFVDHVATPRAKCNQNVTDSIDYDAQVLKALYV